MHLPASAPGLVGYLGDQTVVSHAFAPRVPQFGAFVPILHNQGLRSFAFASLPAAGTATGETVIVTDVGTSASLWYSNGTRWIPTSPVILGRSGAAVSAGAVTTEETLATVTVPANTLGISGSLNVDATFSYTNSVNNKTFRFRFDGAAGTEFLARTDTTNVVTRANVWVANRDATNSQIGSTNPANGAFGASNVAPATAAVDTTAATTVAITGQKASSGETLTLERYIVVLHP